MSEQNKTILLSANAAVVRGDHEAFLDHLTDDAEWTFVGDQVLRGKAAVRAYIAETYVRPPAFTVDRLIAEGDMLTAEGHIRLPDAEGREVHYEYCDVWRIRDGKLAELRAYVVAVEG